MFSIAVSKVSWKWAASWLWGKSDSYLNSLSVFSGVPRPTVSPRETSQHPMSSKLRTTYLTLLGQTFPSKGQPMTIETYPLTSIPLFLAYATTGTHLSRLSLIEQFRFFCEKPSVAEAKMAISLTPASTAVSIPLRLGTRQGQLTPSTLSICWKSYLELAICGTHFGETNEPTSTAFNPVLERSLMSFSFCSSVSSFFSFCSPSRGPTSTILTRCPASYGLPVLNACANCLIFANLIALSITIQIIR